MFDSLCMCHSSAIDELYPSAFLLSRSTYICIKRNKTVVFMKNQINGSFFSKILPFGKLESNKCSNHVMLCIICMSCNQLLTWYCGI